MNFSPVARVRREQKMECQGRIPCRAAGSTASERERQRTKTLGIPDVCEGVGRSTLLAFPPAVLNFLDRRGHVIAIFELLPAFSPPPLRPSSPTLPSPPPLQ